MGLIFVDAHTHTPLPYSKETLVRFLIWQFGEISKDCQIKNSPMLIIVCASMALRIQIAKFKNCQYLLRANLPNLMLTKFSHYTVCIVQLSLFRVYFSRLGDHP